MTRHRLASASRYHPTLPDYDKLHPSRMYESFEPHNNGPHSHSAEERKQCWIGVASDPERGHGAGDGTAESQFWFIRDHQELRHRAGQGRRSQRQASLPVPLQPAPTLYNNVLPPRTPLDNKARQLNQLIQHISDPRSYAHTSNHPPRPMRVLSGGG